MDRRLWEQWAAERSGQFRDQPWMLSKWDTNLGIAWPENKIELMIADISEKLRLNENDWLLDAGCGPGWIAQRLNSKAAGVVGLDFSSSMISFAAAAPGISLVQADIANPPFAKDSFQKILIYFTLMNFTDHNLIVKALKKLSRSLAPGGRMLAGQMPLKNQRETYDREKDRYLIYCKEMYNIREDVSKDHAPDIALFSDDYGENLAAELGLKVEVKPSFNHFWREGEPTQCSWRVDYIFDKAKL